MTNGPETGVRAEGDWRRPSPRLRTMRRIEVAVVTLGVAIVAGMLGWQAGSAVGGALVGGAVAAGLVADVFVRRRIRVWAYREREDDLLVRRGVMFARLSVVPYGRMQFIDVTAGPIERSFRLATVRMHTAAAASDARIPGLPQEEAARLRDRLAALGESRVAGL